MLQLAALDVVQFVAIEVGHHWGRGDAQRLLPVDIPGHHIVAMEQSLQKGAQVTRLESNRNFK